MEPLTVCLIEDDDAYLFLAKAMIKSVSAAIRVLSFTGGKDALDFFVANSTNIPALPQIIFLDLNMPGMDGWHFLDAYEKQCPQLASQIPLYILSSSIAEKDRNRAAQNKLVADYIEKPLSSQQFSDIIKLRSLKTN